mmetsp:Transcript_21821/g.43849  ORF Transcript_21821/g.43849 Transcript_21821/m.43849 type:complete len:291 (-) Transcript_21821:860-1732(-)
MRANPYSSALRRFCMIQFMLSGPSTPTASLKTVKKSWRVPFSQLAYVPFFARGCLHPALEILRIIVARPSLTVRKTGRMSSPLIKSGTTVRYPSMNNARISSIASSSCCSTPPESTATRSSSPRVKFIEISVKLAMYIRSAKHAMSPNCPIFISIVAFSYMASTVLSWRLGWSSFILSRNSSVRFPPVTVAFPGTTSTVAFTVTFNALADTEVLRTWGWGVTLKKWNSSKVFKPDTATVLNFILTCVPPRLCILNFKVGNDWASTTRVPEPFVIRLTSLFTLSGPSAPTR